ncbi:MAG: cytochrome c oxidase accessory protein CcoG [Bacteroidota bacterium]|uniref:Type cbb3 cytochrome oxidase biogenesis protein CcoG, involved in Cu oxidation n=1 Tax=Christiangramia flava JLT2011 TaxID=1229726 RepID=A0A1L7I3Y6_9FLAO|nr:cytochrome c oxidase accessory protein CcoG [Christiangramia flava]APU68320.1 Type cbb3 cytochrome oxidase biogenesis protein CcoG, involved in Cu oxidation [Christiangramia flava JLT2011]MEE2772260.1 cytochrome c oxidase accessory protein CcoG [Bacteroidota bacterium]OSS40893.1 Type cbb3 cytochrome oxidase biogenesis protein CcoG, involved in Cu oxidation [Christiangramia flava JLT2011]
MEREKFRDSIATVDQQGKRSWVYPRKPAGRLYRYRQYVSYLLLAFLVASPFIKINGNQFLMFNVLERRFSIFGFTFWPQDFYIFVLIMIIGVVFIILFTVAFGRIFCGWICPQTIFMEMVFRRIEYWIEGDRGKQIKLDKQKWNAEKLRKKLMKWSIFFFISFLIANIFLAYLIGSDRLLLYVFEGPSAHLSTLLSLLIFTAVFYFVFAWFREQVCVIACPYGRLQGVLLDERSIVVAYDYQRGEKEKGRAKFKKNENRAATGKGDCIDCLQCVQVCPTGIDIRNGTQLECVNCTACIDACNTMMEAVDLPKGLIRYASEANIRKKEPFRFTARLKAYSAVLLILIGVLSGLLFLRSDIEANVLRLPGQLYQHRENGIISNVYTYKLINKTSLDYEDLQFRLLSHSGEIETIGNQFISVASNSFSEGTLFVNISRKSLAKEKEKLEIGVYSNDHLIETTSVTFMGPRTYK